MCIMKGISERQREILNFIQSFLRQNAFWPSIRDIQSHFGFKSTNAVMGHLRALERKQILTRIPGQARTFKFTEMEVDFPNQPREMLDIPVYGSIAAGYPDRVEASGEIGRLQIDIETAGIRPGQNAFALKVRGESMINAGILDGDTVIIQPGVLVRDGDIVAALIDGETTLKRYIQKRGTSPYLKAENEEYPELYPTTELLIQGVCKAVIRNL